VRLLWLLPDKDTLTSLCDFLQYTSVRPNLTVSNTTDIASTEMAVNGTNGANGTRSVNGTRPNPELLQVNGLQTNGDRVSSPESPGLRRASNPMMPAFMVSAPGKVIVFGEHAVVHGKVRYRSPHTLCDLSILQQELTFASQGRHRSLYKSSLLPSCYNPFQIQAHCLASLPRYRPDTYVEYRRATLGDVFAPV
jgi:hypothetical protein